MLLVKTFTSISQQITAINTFSVFQKKLFPYDRNGVITRAGDTIIDIISFLPLAINNNDAMCIDRSIRQSINLNNNRFNHKH